MVLPTPPSLTTRHTNRSADNNFDGTFSVDDAKVCDVVRGETVGEMSLLFGLPRAAHVKATTACKLWSIDRRSYASLQLFLSRWVVTMPGNTPTQPRTADFQAHQPPYHSYTPSPVVQPVFSSPLVPESALRFLALPEVACFGNKYIEPFAQSLGTLSFPAGQSLAVAGQCTVKVLVDTDTGVPFSHLIQNHSLGPIRIYTPLFPFPLSDVESALVYAKPHLGYPHNL